MDYLHQPPCRPGGRPDREAGRVVGCARSEQGWSLLCNGVVVREDTGNLLPGGRIIAAHRIGYCKTFATARPPHARSPGLCGVCPQGVLPSMRIRHAHSPTRHTRQVRDRPTVASA
jgi:Family of unknown function (DUF5999)